jgi:hypothetical protein
MMMKFSLNGAAPVDGAAAAARLRADVPYLTDSTVALILRTAVSEYPHAMPSLGGTVRAIRSKTP